MPLKSPFPFLLLSLMVQPRDDLGPHDTLHSDEIVPLTSVTGASKKDQEKENWTENVPSHLEPYLQTPATVGLTDEQVLERRARFGRNELAERKRNKIIHFFSFCKKTSRKKNHLTHFDILY